ncbi:hypothetical protein GJAV_G00136820 [Gymnothorax javanicus]|nr:hypothetical protein GJAV_G00136820 [Gymnothorax javanicus]
MAECAIEKTLKAPAAEVMSPPTAAEKRLQTSGQASLVHPSGNQSSPAQKQTEVMSPPTAAEKRLQTSGQASLVHPSGNQTSPARKQTMSPSSVAEKKPQTNGHASPARIPVNPNSPSGKQYVEGFLRTDDRMRLAKERREEREKSLAARELAIREKERRAQLQYERTVEERWRRLEEQRQREELRRAAVEEKRRQRLEEEKERLEALMRRSMERNLQLEQRSKRWAWGSTGGAREGDCENALFPRSAASVLPHEIAASLPAASEFSDAADFLSASAMTLSMPQDLFLSKRLSSSSATIVHTAERAPPSPHRSPYRGSPGRGGRRRARTGSPGLSEDNTRANMSPENLKTEKLRREKRTASPGTGSPIRRPESPAMASMRCASPVASRIMSKSRAQSPSTIREYPPSPLKHRSATPNTDGNKRKLEGEGGEEVTKEKREEEIRGDEPCEKMTINTSTPDEKVRNMKMPEKKATKAEMSARKSSKMETPEISKAEMSEKKTFKAETPEKTSMVDTSVTRASKAEMPKKETLNVETPEKKMAKSSSSDLSGDKSAEPSPVTPTGKPIAGTTDAEEASRLLAERRRQARLQKELEDKQRREQEEEERARVAEHRKRQAEARAKEEEEARQVEVEKQRQEQECKLKEEEKRKHRQCQERELQIQMDRERAEGELQAQKEAERHRQEREVQKLQEEQERLQRKKRIEEIMKRTRKTDAEMKKEEVCVELSSPSSLVQPVSPPPLETQGEVLVKVQLTAQVNGQVIGQPLLELGDAGGTIMKSTPSPQPDPTGKPLPSPPRINLEPLEVKSTLKSRADEVESMEVSPVSKEELISIPEFSPIEETPNWPSTPVPHHLISATSSNQNPGIGQLWCGDLQTCSFGGFTS